MDEGRRYWKAAIAHLAPEKREAAWEFYLDRLESSAAADTLGGVMLLLEAHLAFFDDLPARLGRAAQQIESAAQTTNQSTHGSGLLASATSMASATRLPRRWCAGLVAGISAAVGGVATGAIILAVQHHGTAAPGSAPDQANGYWFPRTEDIRVEPWNEAQSHRQRGAIVSLASVAWTERTASGGAIIYVNSPIEDVRRDLQALRQKPN